MPLDLWNERNESLNAFGHALQQGTYGLIRDLAFDHIDDDCLVVRGVSPNYYGVQLAIQAARQFENEHRTLPETRLLIRVAGSLLELVLIPPVTEESCDQRQPATPSVATR